VANILVVHWAMSCSCGLGLEATDSSAQANAYWMVSENHGGAPAFVR
jgi:hypothetical protein